VHPVHSQAQAVGPWPRFKHDRARAVRQRPPQEAGVRRVRRAGRQRTAHQLRADGHGHRVLAKAHRGYGGLERRHPRSAHPGGRQQLHRAAAKPAVHHCREPGNQHVTLGRPGREHAHLLRAESPVRQCPPGCLRRQFLVEHQGHAAVVHGVVPRLDPVRRQRPAAQRGGAGVVTAAEPGGELFVVDRVAGQEGAGTSDVGLVHDIHSAIRQAGRAWAGLLSWPRDRY
jgi:hypothetical protein